MSEQEACAADKTDANTYLKSICDLLTEGKSKFFIPSYQRGYRWTCRQVEDLLNDILEFSEDKQKKLNEKKNLNDYYCLQPLIIKRRDDSADKWEVIDGQQRLTTLYLILRYLSLDDKFEICYETREKSVQFLSKLNNEYVNNSVANNEEVNSNVDFLHMFNAYKAINNWFGEDGNKIELDVLLNHIKFIWYEVKDEDQRDVFTRFNMGKIPLSNAELIKALFLQRKNFGDQEEAIRRKQLEIAMEWDTIEFTLQNDEFWYFLNKKKCETPTRIEFILDLVASSHEKCKDEKNKDKDFSFRYFYNELKEIENDNLSGIINELWSNIRKCYLTFKDWFHDNEVYSYVGFLIRAEEDKAFSLSEMVSEYQKEKKDIFKKSLKKKIQSLFDKMGDIEDLHYWSDKEKTLIRNIFLLFNVKYASLGGGNDNIINQRFSFHLYQNHIWHIEHIYPQTPKKMETAEQWKNWFSVQLSILENELEMTKENNIESIITIQDNKAEIEKKIKEMNDDYSNNLTQEVAGEKLAEYLKIDNNIRQILRFNLHGIGNLALLDQSSNQAIQNYHFNIKRKKIIEINNEKSFFILPCTLYAFLKFFTKEPSQFYYWSKEDADDYVNVISETLKDYLPQQIKENR